MDEGNNPKSSGKTPSVAPQSPNIVSLRERLSERLAKPNPRPQSKEPFGSQVEGNKN